MRFSQVRKAVSLEQLGRSLAVSRLFTADEVKALWAALPIDARPKTADAFADRLVADGKLTRFQADEILAGRINLLVLGDYTVVERIGAGGMGQVFKAHHRRLDKFVALKVLAEKVMQDPEAVKRFQREVRAAGKVVHPNLVVAHDAGEAHGVHYLVMEYVEGRDLAELVKRHGPLPIEQAVSCVLQAARGLEHAHKRGLIHRDIKPNNLLLDSEGTVKILDLGLARIDDPLGTAAEENLTGTGNIMGTIDYMPPEQALDTKRVDARADVYSLGCTLYYLLTARKPYDGDTVMKRLLAHREAPIPSLSESRQEVPTKLDAVYRRMVAKQPDQRYADMSEVIRALQAASPTAGQSLGETSRLNRQSGSESSALKAFLENLSKAAAPPGGPGTSLHSAPQGEDAASKGSNDSARDDTFGTRTAKLSDQEVEQIAALSPVHTASAPLTPVRRGEHHVSRVGLAPLAPARGEGPGVRGSGSRPPMKLIAAGLGGLALFIALGVWVIIRDKDGNEVAKLQVPAGGTVVVGQPFQADNNRQALQPDNTRQAGKPDNTHQAGKPDLPPSKAATTVGVPPSGGPQITPPSGPAKAGTPAPAKAVTPTVPPRPKPVVSAAPSPFDALRREDIAADELREAGFGDPAKAPKELVAVFGAGRGKHWAGITCLAYSPDGETVASCSTDGIKLWDAVAGGIRTSLLGHAAGVNRVAFSPDGRWLASASADKTVKLWDVATSQERATLIGHTDAVMCVVFSPDGNLIASAGIDAAIILWDAKTAEKRAELTGHTRGIRSIAFTPDGRTLASLGEDGLIMLWDVEIGRLQNTLTEVGTSPVCVVAFSPDGQTLASVINRPGSINERIKLWNVAEGSVKSTLDDNFYFVGFTPDGKTILAMEHGLALRIWDAATMQERSKFKIGGFRGGTGQPAIHPNGSEIALGGYEATIRVYDIATGREKRSLTGEDNEATCVAVSADGRTLAWGGGRTLNLRDLTTGRTQAVPASPISTQSISSLAINPKGRTVAVAATGQTLIRQFDVETGKAQIDVNGTATQAIVVTYSPDGETLAAAGNDGIVRLWDAATGKEKGVLQGHSGAVTAVAFSRDGSRLASLGADKQLKFWDVVAGKETTSYGPVEGTNIAFSPDGRTVASGAGAFEFVDTMSGKFYGKKNIAAGSRSFAYSPDGATLLIATEAGKIILQSVDVVTDQQTIQLGPKQGSVNEAVFDPTGRYVVTANRNGTVYVLRIHDKPTTPREPTRAEE